jgi:hypothetical protein
MHVFLKISRNFLSKALFQDALDVIPIEEILLERIEVDFNILTVLCGPTIFFPRLIRFTSILHILICIVLEFESKRWRRIDYTLFRTSYMRGVSHWRLELCRDSHIRYFQMTLWRFRLPFLYVSDHFSMWCFFARF